jgi:hypothetical protein
MPSASKQNGAPLVGWIVYKPGEAEQAFYVRAQLGLFAPTASALALLCSSARIQKAEGFTAVC